MSRRLARETALQVLFQRDLTGELEDKEHIVRQWAKEFAVPEASIPFALEIVEGTLVHIEEIDSLLTKYSASWGIKRMGNVDRNLLRIAIYEILYREDIPGRVSINEALEIAKRYSSADSSRFINGILDKVAASTNKKEEKK